VAPYQLDPLLWLSPFYSLNKPSRKLIDRSSSRQDALFIAPEATIPGWNVGLYWRSLSRQARKYGVWGEKAPWRAKLVVDSTLRRSLDREVQVYLLARELSPHIWGWGISESREAPYGEAMLARNAVQILEKRHEYETFASSSRGPSSILSVNLRCCQSANPFLNLLSCPKLLASQYGVRHP
jgi:hypothetical protein